MRKTITFLGVFIAFTAFAQRSFNLNMWGGAVQNFKKDIDGYDVSFGSDKYFIQYPTNSTLNSATHVESTTKEIKKYHGQVGFDATYSPIGRRNYEGAVSLSTGKYGLQQLEVKGQLRLFVWSVYSTILENTYHNNAPESILDNVFIGYSFGYDDSHPIEKKYDEWTFGVSLRVLENTSAINLEWLIGNNISLTMRTSINNLKVKQYDDKSKKNNYYR
jgi:hypothetical protein